MAGLMRGNNVAPVFPSGGVLLPRLINDKAYADQSLAEFTGLVRQLNEAVAKINAGQGTAGKVINDPGVYESINDILIGINESKLLRWLIRNRQEKGIEKRYQIEQSRPATPTPTTSAEPPAPAVPPPPATDTTSTSAPVVPTTSAATTSTAGPPPM